MVLEFVDWRLIMSIIEKLYSIIILLSVAIGLGAGQFEFFKNNADFLIVPLLVGMLYVIFLQIPVEDLKNSFKNVKFTYVALAINFIWTPVLAWLLALIFLADTPALWIGFIMLMVTPCTDWYLIFTGIARGNVPLSTTILPVNLILQILLLPVYLLIFGGTTGFVNLSFLVESVFIVLLTPLALAIITKVMLRNKESFKDKLLSKIGVIPIIFLSLAFAAMFASQGQLLLNNIDLLLKLLIPILLFFIINFIFAQRVAGFCKFSYADKASLSLTTLARNSPIALAIAITAFPDQPLIALTLVIGPLLELPILTLISQLLILRKKEMNLAAGEKHRV